MVNQLALRIRTWFQSNQIFVRGVQDAALKPNWHRNLAVRVFLVIANHAEAVHMSKTLLTKSKKQRQQFPLLNILI